MIEVKNISRTWGGFSLRDVSLEVKRGECFTILGPCGSGKTLLLETIAGLHTPSQGGIFINGIDVTKLPPERRRVGLVYQQYALFPHLSVRDNVGYGLKYRGSSPSERARRVNEMFELFDIQYLADRPTPEGLSGGEAQKVALARALAVQPEALLLDEPMSSLDERTSGRVTDLLLEIRGKMGVPVIHVTHNYNEAAALADRIAVFREGAIAQTGTVDDVFRRPSDRFVAEFLGVENIFEGVCERREGDSALIKVGDIIIKARSPVEPGPVTLCIRPEEVMLNESNGRSNSFKGRIKEIADRGFSVRMLIETDSITLASKTPRRGFAGMGITAGSEVYFSLPEEDLHVMVSDYGSNENDD